MDIARMGWMVEDEIGRDSNGHLAAEGSYDSLITAEQWLLRIREHNPVLSKESSGFIRQRSTGIVLVLRYRLIPMAVAATAGSDLFDLIRQKTGYIDIPKEARKGLAPLLCTMYPACITGLFSGLRHSRGKKP